MNGSSLAPHRMEIKNARFVAPLSEYDQGKAK